MDKYYPIFPNPITYISEVKANSEDKNASGFYDQLNQQQYDALQDFKKQILDKKILENFEEWDDLYLLRFLRARKFEVEKSLIMFEKFINWRKTENVDDLRENWQLTELFQVKELYPHGYHKTDKLGRPVYIELYDKLDVKALFKVTTDKRMITYYIKQYERQMRYILPACSAEVKKPVEQSCTVLDVNGIGITAVVGPIRAFLKLASSIGQDYYPEMLGKMTVINVGFFFRAVWSLAKGFIDPKTANKINLVKGKGEAELLEIIEKDNLPKFLGGNCECNFKFGCLGSDIGPWNKEGGITVGEETTKL